MAAPKPCSPCFIRLEVKLLERVPINAKRTCGGRPSTVPCASASRRRSAPRSMIRRRATRCFEACGRNWRECFERPEDKVGYIRALWLQGHAGRLRRARAHGPQAATAVETVV